MCLVYYIAIDACIIGIIYLLQSKREIFCKNTLKIDYLEIDIHPLGIIAWRHGIVDHSWWAEAGDLSAYFMGTMTWEI